MATRDARTPEQKIRQLEMELADKEREFQSFRQQLGDINSQLEKFINQIASELKMANVIQRSLVPTEIPTIPGFRFSTKFIGSSLQGGDYFDVFELEDKMQFGLLMSSSSGHGMASLFMSVLLKLTTQIEAKKGMEPDEVLRGMAKEIQENIQGNDTARVFYAVIDRRRYDFSYAKAGNILAYIHKYSEDTLVKLDKGATSIGRDNQPQFKTETIKLDPRDRVIVCTEGITKVVNSDDEAFGEDRLHQIILDNIRVGCHELRNEILFQASKFADGREYPHDISVAVMEVKDKVIKLRKG